MIMEEAMKAFLSIVLLLLATTLPFFGEEAIVIGSKEGEGYLTFPRQVAEGPDGNIYVYDMADAFIKVYSPDGNFLRKIGGKGQGPGEVQREDGLTFCFTPDGKLFFTEYFGGHPWITLMELSGELYKVIKLEIKEFFGVSDAVSLEDGGFLVEFAFSGRPEKKKDYFLHRSPRELVHLDPQGRILSKIKRAEYLTRISFLDQGADLGIPFVPVFAWCPFKEGMVLFSDGLSTNLHVYDYKGKLIKEIAIPLPEPHKVTKRDLDEWKERIKENIPDKIWYNQFGRVIEKYKKSIYEKIPNLSSLSLTPEGNILISGSWLLDEEGKTLVHIGTEAYGIRITPSFLFLVSRDEEENTLIHRLKRKGSEEEDLLGIGR
jgi:hypothetical protein